MHPLLARLKKTIDSNKLPRFLYVAQDNTNEVSEKDKEIIQGYFTVFVIDTSEQTHLCEATPSFYLKEVSIEVLYFDEVKQQADFEEIDARICDEYVYIYHDSSTYVHVSDVTEENGWVPIDTWNPENSGFQEKDHSLYTIDDAIEVYQGNPVL